jgi:protein-tyrosine-phosphatase
LWRAGLHAALGDPHRLAIVDELALSDRAPSELAAMLGIDSNLLAHHLSVLEQHDLVERVASQGDQRRHYVRLIPATLADVSLGPTVPARRVVFVCTENVARSQLAAAMWNDLDVAVTAVSGGTRPGREVHPGTIRAADRLGLDLRRARPGPIPRPRPADLVVTVCDKAHEALRASGHGDHLHWSVPDPVASGRARAFDAAASVLRDRIGRLAPAIEPV